MILAADFAYGADNVQLWFTEVMIGILPGDGGTTAVREAKKAIHEGLQMDVRTALRFEVAAYNRLTGTEDRIEGTLAWNEKRKPQFKGR